MRIVCVAVIVVGGVGCEVAERAVDTTPPPPVAECNSWRQWGNNAAHDGASCVTGQPLHAAYAPIALDRRGRVFALNSGHLAVIGR